MKFDKDPPTQKSKGEFPVLSEIVTVANCWYYLSLLERFVDVIQSIQQEEQTLKMYLVRAEYRYFKWIAGINKVPFLRRDENVIVPPLDVAFFWQAHLLSPVRYGEDTYRAKIYNPIKMPLQMIHILQGNPSKEIHSLWKKFMGEKEPYNLSVFDVLDPKSYASVTCIVCFSKIESPWKEYAEWRTDHSIALQCHCCDAMFTVKHVGKANLFADNNEKVHNTAGLLTTSLTRHKIKPDYAQLLLLPLKSTKALPFNQGLKVTLDNHFKQMRGDNPSVEEAGYRKRLTDAIQSTYLCTPYRGSSLDLIQAVARQYKFAYKATKVINWDIPQGIINGIRNYSNFLDVMKENPTLTAVPTFEIDLAWHTHMLFHKHYRKFTTSWLGKMVNHDDTIPETQLENYVKETDLAWQKRIQKHKEAMAAPRYEGAVAQQLEVVPFSTIEKEKKSRKIALLKSFFSPSFSKNKATSSSNVVQSGYKAEGSLLRKQYSPGTYKSTPPYKAIFEVSSDEKEGNLLDESDYDKNTISFHDKRDVKDFIKLNNDDQVMDLTFASVKSSVYGHIGTSTCANTEYLDQWEKDPDTGRARPISDIELLKQGTEVSRYTKVFLTKGTKPRFTRAKGQLPLKESPGYKKYNSYYESQNVRYNTAGDYFNWYLISMAWYTTQPPLVISNTNGSGGGWSSCGNNGISSGGMSSNCGATASSCGGALVGGSSSCGGGVSSCGGFSGGGGSPSCGGGGC